MTGDDWVVPEDDYEPFDESMVIEFQYQIFATRDEAERFAAALHDVIAPIVGSVGRCQTGRIELTSAANGQHDERHSASRRRRNLDRVCTTSSSLSAAAVTETGSATRSFTPSMQHASTGNR